MTAVRVVPWDPAWPERYAALEEELFHVLGDATLAIHHVGSTSVPGLRAKPVIDVLVEAEDLDTVDRAAPALEAAGWEARGEYGIEGRRYFVRPLGEGMLAHVHAYPRGHPRVAGYLRLRDYLRAHPDAAALYGGLKRDLAARHPHDRKAYQAEKADFVDTLHRWADAWSRGEKGELGIVLGIEPDDAPVSRPPPLAWTTATAGGLALGLPLGLAVAAALERWVGAALVTPLAMALAGALLGVAQAMVLGTRLPGRRRWVVASTVGLALGGTVGVVLVEAVGRELTGGQVRFTTTGPAGLAGALVALGVLAGGALGWAQTRAACWRGGRALEWTVATGGGLALSWLVGLAVATGLFGGPTEGAGAATLLGLGAVTFGALTWYALPEGGPAWGPDIRS